MHHTFENGDRYDGDEKNGLPAGRGTMYRANKSVYEGEWADGNMHGKGTLTLVNGTCYQGRWVNGQMTGRGEIIYPDGRVYRGDIVDGMRHGHGQLSHFGGEWFEGEFINDHITENGTYHDDKGHSRTADEQKAAKRPGFMKKLWIRTRRLWISLIFFGLAIVVGMWTVSVSEVVLPICIAFVGLTFFFGFCNDISITFDEDEE